MQRFRTHLYSLKMENKITDWTDRMIKTGTSWNEKIQKEPIQGLCKTDIGSFWPSLPSPLPLGDG